MDSHLAAIAGRSGRPHAILVCSRVGLRCGRGLSRGATRASLSLRLALMGFVVKSRGPTAWIKQLAGNVASTSISASGQRFHSNLLPGRWKMHAVWGFVWPSRSSAWRVGNAITLERVGCLPPRLTTSLAGLARQLASLLSN